MTRLGARQTDLRRSYTDRRSGVHEELIQPRIGGSETVGVLSRHVDRSQGVGWVVCPPFGPDQGNLVRHDAVVARALAAAGFVVLRYHGQGYGDSSGSPTDVSLSSHLRDAADAVELVAALGGVGSVGVTGSRFGGTVAALSAERLSLPWLAVVDPVVHGAAYMRELLRSQFLWELSRASERGSSSSGRELRDRLTARGWLDVRGFLLTLAAYEQIAGLDLLSELVRFGGRSLVVAVSRSGRTPGPAAALGARLAELGGSCDERVIEDRGGRPLGAYPYEDEFDRRRRVDLQFDLVRSVAASVAAWAVEGTGRGAAR